MLHSNILFALLILRTSGGRVAFERISGVLLKILHFSGEGTRFVFGPLFDGFSHVPGFSSSSFVFVLGALVLIIFFSALINMLYYLRRHSELAPSRKGDVARLGLLCVLAATPQSQLVIDGFGLEKLTPEQAHDFYGIVSGRYERRATIITSNRHVAKWVNLFDDQIIANSALDRLAHNAHQMIIGGESYRKKKGTIGSKL
ncbi:MAG: ATP-binding protein [Deltaproteobacteria bacterium]|nr:ATP-binding protein [Deltaproteobacteria bacterium]